MDEAPITYQGQLTEEDAVKGMTAFLVWRRTGYRMLPVWAVGILIASFVLNPRGSLLSRLLPPVLFAALNLAIIPVIRSNGARRFARDARQLYHPFTSRFSSGGFDTVTERDRIHREWSDFSGWRELDGHFLLFEGKTNARILPKRLLGAQQDALRALFERQLGPAV
jgi:YcxB-like protein